MNIRKEGELLKPGWNFTDNGSYRVHLCFLGEVDGHKFKLHLAVEKDKPINNPDSWSTSDIELPASSELRIDKGGPFALGDEN